MPASKRSRRVSGARRELIRLAVLTHGMRAVDVSQYLGISRSSVTEHLRAVS
jgi:predicted ArsR family transcriptional regulator